MLAKRPEFAPLHNVGGGAVRRGLTRGRLSREGERRSACKGGPMNPMTRIALLAFVVALPGGLAGAEGEAARQAEAAGVWLDEGYALRLCAYARVAKRISKSDAAVHDPAVALKYARTARGLADEAVKWSGGKSCRQLWDEQPDD